MAMFPPPDRLRPDVQYAWTQEAGDNFRDPRLIHRKYWGAYNTITIPLLSPEEFYADALAAARDSETVRELELALDKKSKERRQEMETAFGKIRTKTQDFHQDFSGALRDASSHGSLSSFARALTGVAYGWDQVQATGFLDLDYHLPKDHWRRTKNPDDTPFKQADPFYDMVGNTQDHEDEQEWYLDADPSRVVGSSDAKADALEGEYKHSETCNGSSQKQIEGATASQAATSSAEYAGANHIKERQTDDEPVEQSDEEDTVPETKTDTATTQEQALDEDVQTTAQASHSERNSNATHSEPSRTTNPAASSSLDISPETPTSVSASVTMPPSDPSTAKSEKQKAAEASTAAAPETNKNDELLRNAYSKHDQSKSPPATPSSARKRSRSELDEGEDAGSRHSKRRISDESNT